MPPPPAIDLSHVSKTYKGKVQALRDVSIRIHQGEVFGLLGPNGAGKSTLVKILMTVIRPTRASGTVLGAPVGDKATLARVGYLPEHHKFPEYLTGAQVLDFYGAMSKMPRAQRLSRAAELLDTVGMTAWAASPVKSYSKGMRQRLGIAQALMHSPDLVVLDEPTDGVDPVGRRDIRGMVQRMRDEGKTVLLNSHLLSELEMVCDRVGIMVKGKVTSIGTLDELTLGQDFYIIEYLDPQPAAHIVSLLPGLTVEPRPAGAFAGAPRDDGVELSGRWDTGVWVRLLAQSMHVGTADLATVWRVVDWLRRDGIMIKSVRQSRPTLEDLFIQAVTDPTTGKALTPGAMDAKKVGAAS
ncbi:MAG: ATP-binding cassette domain-containing protein [Tepidisphaera sp.]|nr:ATP-binding cassette domain-containing protein [Tepidisphaera sp.]